MSDSAVTYSSYLRIDDLLALQQPLSDGPEHDEMLFIVIHQVYELWFKQVLWELDHVAVLLQADDQVRSGHTLRRVLAVLKVLVSQMDVLETMTPLEFMSFRSRLAASSGFQSAQFRELEFLLGQKDPDAVDRADPSSDARRRLERRLAAPSLWDEVCAHLARHGLAIPAHVLDRDVRRPVEPDAALQEVLIDAYRRDPGVVGLLERLVDLDEGLQEWRYRHVKMVQRTIGTKTGTGGSSGVGYLRTTLDRPVFPDLWAVRAAF
ncbi:MAG: tryptophan 2,3-dioxygenase [Ilumatobacteraceae bacterium]